MSMVRSGWASLTTAVLLALGLALSSPPPAVAQAFTPGAPVPDVPVFPPIALNARLAACLPKRLHPVSRQFLDLWLAGLIGTRTFRRFFHMPNSDYLPVGECLVRVRKELLAESRRFSPI